MCARLWVGYMGSKNKQMHFSLLRSSQSSGGGGGEWRGIHVQLNNHTQKYSKGENIDKYKMP